MKNRNGKNEFLAFRCMFGFLAETNKFRIWNKWEDPHDLIYIDVVISLGSLGKMYVDSRNYLCLQSMRERQRGPEKARFFTMILELRIVLF